MKISYSNKFDYKTQRLEWANDNKHICVLPYKSKQFYHSKNAVSPCCNLIIENSDEGFDHINKLKSSVESKQLYKNCRECYSCEDQGKISERTRFLLELTDNQIENFLQNVFIDDVYIHCTLSNKCNMACRSCNSNTSTLYAKIESGYEHKTISIFNNRKYENNLHDTIKEAIISQKQINLVISGGEGFIQEDFFKLNDWIIDNNYSRKINLTINTNGTIVNNNLLNSICNNYLKVKLAVSVDSIDENYHYVRWPGTWEKLENNLNSFEKFASAYSNFEFFLTPVWSINNIFYIDSWINYFSKTNLSAYDTPLYQPEWLDIQNLPNYLKEKLEPILLKLCNNEWLQNNKSFYANVKNIISLCRDKTESSKRTATWNTYLKKTAQWDSKTNTSLSVHNRKLYNLLSEEDRNIFNKWLN